MSSQQQISFDQLLIASSLPPPGPAHYEARRRLWLTPRAHSDNLAPKPNLYRRQQLANYLGSRDPFKINKLWTIISSSKRHFSDRIPLSLMIPIIHAGWICDQTWPADAVAPDSDETQQYSSPSPFPDL
ncbi:hypothetical protein AMATHDRAFT_175225 [Amanita thiersii Skay4041]|uniref:Uncharacterized protein n=1 Tax=Amanita thiersii Skay4041 TaxID=703135 RepID=A0A2A9NPW8_9AGAR|nr:hypothetical protein AMATHDRAFT_175225 [Amanita thiersii Skay4041]